jgi:GTPase SAR1 family protein
MFEEKIAVVGESGVGKTAMVLRYIMGVFIERSGIFLFFFF